MKKGWMAIRVGCEGEPKQRFVVPLNYLKHPLFAGLLKEAEEEYGFHQQGAIAIPCHVEEFQHLRGVIDRDTAGHQQHHFLHFSTCFRV